jgi:hypothetical protein
MIFDTDRAHALLNEWTECKGVVVKNFDRTLALDHTKRDIDQCALQLRRQMLYGDDVAVVEQILDEFAIKLDDYQKKLTEDILRHGPV